MEDKIQRLVNAANSTNAKAKEIGEMQLRELGLDNNGNPLKSASTKATKPKAERKKREPKAKGEPKPKYKVGDVLNHTYMDETYKVKILAVTGWTGDGHRYDIEFLDENLKPMNKFAKSYDDKLSRLPKSKSDQPYDCDDLIAKAEERKAKAKANAIKRANEPKKTDATKNKEAIEKAATRVEKNVEKRVKKDEISFGEIKKLIAEYEDAIAKLKVLLAKAEGKMAKGGGVDAEEVEHILMKAKGVKEHHCGCGGSKMANGGGVEPMVVPKGDGTYKVINDKWMVVGIRKEDAKPLPEWKQKGMGKSAYNDRLRLKEINEIPFFNKERAEEFIKEQQIEKYFTNIKVVPFIEPKRNSMSAGYQTKRYGRGQYESMANGGGVGESEEVYIEFMNKDKGFKVDRKSFKSYEEAKKWASKNFERFDPDMIKYK